MSEDCVAGLAGFGICYAFCGFVASLVLAIYANGYSMNLELDIEQIKFSNLDDVVRDW